MFREAQQIGNYTLIRPIGRGGFGEVWLAERRTALLTTKVAVKLPHDSLIDLETVRQEAILWEKASGHPNVLPIIEANIYDGQVVIVSEFAPDGSLSDLLKTAGKLSLEKAVEIAIGIIAGLDFLHSRRIIHRDIKPQNILLQGETPRLADFGISHALQTSVASRSANIKGTFSYMAPETFDGKRNEQTDIWAVGVVLYQMLTGNLPFPQTETTALFGAIIMREPEPLPDEIPAKLKEIVGQSLAKLPENRYKSAREMREDLQKVLVGIAHPTFAPTEVLNKKTIEPLLETTDHTVVRQAPSPVIPQTQVAQPAPFVAHPVPNELSIVTEVQLPTQKVSLDPIQFETKPPQKKSILKRYKIFYFIPLIVLILLAIPVSPYLIYYVVKATTPSIRITERDSKLPSIANVKIIPCQKNKKWGFCDVSGKVYIEQKYEKAAPFKEGFAPITVGDYWLGSKSGFIDSAGREVVFYGYGFVLPFSEDLALFSKDGKFGYIDKNLQEVIPPKFVSAAEFQSGRAAIDSDGDQKFGYINKSGKTVLPEIYLNYTDFSDGLASYGTGNCTYFNTAGENVFSAGYDKCGSFSEGLASVKSKDQWGFIDKTGKLVIPFTYDEAGDFSEGLAAVRQNNQIGFIDNHGKTIIPFNYDNGPKYLYNQFKGGLAPVALNGKWGYINRYNQAVVPFKYSAAQSFADGIALVETGPNDPAYIANPMQ